MPTVLETLQKELEAAEVTLQQAKNVVATIQASIIRNTPTTVRPQVKAPVKKEE